MPLKHSIKMAALNTIRWSLTNFYQKPAFLIKLALNSNQYCNHVSYYPEKKTKAKNIVFWEQVKQTIRFGYPNEFYFSYGFDVKNSDEMEQYIHYAPFSKLRDKYNIARHGSTAILRNKFYFGMFCDYLGINSGDNIGLITGNDIYIPHNKQHISVEQFCSEQQGSFFVKLVNGECGCGIFTLNIENGIIQINGIKSTAKDIIEISDGGTFLIQRKIIQHPEMSRLHPQSLNSIRLVTIRNIKTGKIAPFPSILRVGTGDSFVDNTSQGGIAVGINFDTCRLKQYGFLKPKFGGRVECHPNSKIKFSEFTIPYLKEAVEQAIFLHSMLSDIHSIGWDVAIGENGPIFIEGNDNWEINGPQICNGGLKNTFKTMLCSNK